MINDFAHVADHGSRWFGKEDRPLGILDLQRARPRTFVDVLLVIDPEHDAILFWLRDRRDYLCLVRLHQRADGDEFLLLISALAGHILLRFAGHL